MSNGSKTDHLQEGPRGCPNIEKLRQRDLIIRSIRKWFFSNGFMEVQTPVMAREVAIEAYIETFNIDSDNGEGLTLLPSPELFMKRLLACGAQKIFQISHVFRKDEKGRLHNPEFVMLEWYRVEADYNTIMQDCEDIVRAAAFAVNMQDTIIWQGETIDITPPFIRMSINEAFQIYAGWTPGSSPAP